MGDCVILRNERQGMTGGNEGTSNVSELETSQQGIKKKQVESETIRNKAHGGLRNIVTLDRRRDL